MGYIRALGENNHIGNALKETAILMSNINGIEVREKRNRRLWIESVDGILMRSDSRLSKYLALEKVYVYCKDDPVS